MGRVISRAELIEVRRELKKNGRRIVFTNGCFDLLHRGHIEYLAKAKSLGDSLIVGLNANRPITPQEDRAEILAALAVVDYVCIFDEDTPYELIQAVVPDILVKGADWTVDDVVGKDIVEAAGGSVHTIEFLPNRSTTNIIQKIAQIVTTQS
jgi:D-beta-D-heptose 7-phosphate kinase/D-beta-D-heptose 1-phosphate adenosyltransferase